jgi:hypothetical protein
MKAYLITTGSLFALLAAAHVWQLFVEWHRFATDPWFVVEPAIGLVAACLSVWAWRLVWRLGRPAT